MKLLLDTHILLWWLADSSKLSKKLREYIEDSNNLIFVSIASAWEIAIKCSLGKLSAPSDLKDALKANGFLPVPINLDHALLAGSLPRHHEDPFDRLIIAQSQIDDLTVLTQDKHFKLYDIEIL